MRCILVQPFTIFATAFKLQFNNYFNVIANQLNFRPCWVTLISQYDINITVKIYQMTNTNRTSWQMAGYVLCCRKLIQVYKCWYPIYILRLITFLLVCIVISSKNYFPLPTIILPWYIRYRHLVIILVLFEGLNL